MDWTVISESIRPELFILVLFIWTLGLFLKKAPSFTDEWKIPFISLGVAIVSAFVYMAFVLQEGVVPSVIVTAVIQGTLIAAVAVFGNELFKQFTVKRYRDQSNLL